MVELGLTPGQAALAHQLAAESHAKWGRTPGHYRNLWSSHLLGKLAEVGVDAWLQQHGLATEPIYRDLSKAAEPDVLVDGRGIEIKCWQPRHWEEMGRCVTPAQLKDIAARSDAIVWCVVCDPDSSAPIVAIKGWSKPADVRATAIRLTGPDYKQIPNHQVELEHVRDVPSLLDLMNGRES